MSPVRASVFVGSQLMLVSGPSRADFPVSQNPTVPNTITLVGSHSGVSDGPGTFTIVGRNLNNPPVRGTLIELDFSRCTDLTLCGDPLDAAATVNCAAKTVGKTSDANGTVTFTILGHSNDSGHATTLLNGVWILGNWVRIGTPTASASCP